MPRKRSQDRDSKPRSPSLVPPQDRPKASKPKAPPKADKRTVVSADEHLARESKSRHFGASAGMGLGARRIDAGAELVKTVKPGEIVEMASSGEAKAPKAHEPGGMFTNGGKGGPGNPYAAKIAQLRSAMYRSVSVDDFLAITRAIVKRAKEGDMGAAALLFDRTLGKVRDDGTSQGHQTVLVLNLDGAREAEIRPVEVLQAIRSDESAVDVGLEEEPETTNSSGDRDLEPT